MKNGFRSTALLQTVLFFSLFGMVFLGDGKQAFVDIAAAVVVLLIVGASLLLVRPQRQLPLAPEVLWVCFLLYEVVLIFHSEDAAYSVYTVVRYLEAYLIFSVFYKYSQPGDADSFLRWMLGFAVTLTAVSFLWLLVPFPHPSLPVMNLLTYISGHNHIADILMFGVPAAIVMLLLTGRKIYAGALVVLYSGVLMALSRAAGALAVLFTVVATLLTIKRVHKRAWVGVAAAAISVGIYLVINGNTIFPAVAWARFGRSDFSYSGRFLYWGQAMKAIAARPVFGSGPGTFTLQSHRLQTAPQSYSWFAHNIFLETSVESGLAGGVLFGALCFWIVFMGFKVIITAKTSAEMRALAAAVIMTALYAVVEFNMDFLVVWLLFFAAAGTMMGAGRPRAAGSIGPRPAFVLSAGLVTLFYLSYFLGLLFYMTGNPTASYAVAPYQDVLFVSSGDSRWLLSSPQVKIVDFMSPKRPEVRIALAEAYMIAGNSQRSTDILKQVLLYEPTNEDAHRKYLEALLKAGMYDDVWQWLLVYGTYFLPYPYPSELRKLPPPDTEEIRKQSNFMMVLFNSQLIHEVRFARLFYRFGTDVLRTDPAETEAYWAFSSSLMPNLSYLYIERAALETAAFQNAQAAGEILEACRNTPQSMLDCMKYSVTSLPSPGSLHKDILGDIK